MSDIRAIAMSPSLIKEIPGIPTLYVRNTVTKAENGNNMRSALIERSKMIAGESVEKKCLMEVMDNMFII
jgi:hypothetical protein